MKVHVSTTIFSTTEVLKMLQYLREDSRGETALLDASFRKGYVILCDVQRRAAGLKTPTSV